MNRSISAILVTTLAACGSSESSEPPLTFELSHGARVQVEVAAGAYAAGSTVPLTVTNLGDQVYTWNPCMRTLQRSAGVEWVTVDEPERVCTAEAWVLRPRNRTEATTNLPASLPAGEYRFRYGFSRTAGDHSVTDYQVSNLFPVGP